MDNSLRVDPDVLDHGAAQFHAAHSAIQAALSRARDSHETLQGAWHGRAADAGAQIWADVHDKFRRHLDALADNATKLSVAARLYRGQDASSGADIAQRM
ncbi:MULTISPECIES: WXG100 family type VII secretion target [unclassified Mycobacterium]|uniref:WXG100 family type VII secretion target n=1 Tax=unclassified Mycobacterium TaxID=2642494 RepID=UPI0009DD8F8C|nr:WXG100 family type VII secretion target [Mycobacterium sp. UNC410CL29Cvi84]